MIYSKGGGINLLIHKDLITLNNPDLQ